MSDDEIETVRGCLICPLPAHGEQHTCGRADCRAEHDRRTTARMVALSTVAGLRAAFERTVNSPERASARAAELRQAAGQLGIPPLVLGTLATLGGDNDSRDGGGTLIVEEMMRGRWLEHGAPAARQLLRTSIPPIRCDTDASGATSARWQPQIPVRPLGVEILDRDGVPVTTEDAIVRAFVRGVEPLADCPMTVAQLRDVLAESRMLVMPGMEIRIELRGLAPSEVFRVVFHAMREAPTW